MKTLATYIQQRNQWLALFNKGYDLPLSEESVQSLARDIDAEMSPENLCMDGEATVQQVMKKTQFLNQVAQELEVYAQQAGYDIPTFSEV